MKDAEMNSAGTPRTMHMNILTQFLLWFALLAVLPLLVFTLVTYTRVKKNVETEMQNMLAYDINQARFVLDEKWNNLERYIQMIMNSHEFYSVLVKMYQAVEAGDYHAAQFTGFYQLDTLLKNLLAVDEDVVTAMVIINGRCVYAYQNFITVRLDLTRDALYQEMSRVSHTMLVGGVENPFGALRGVYTLAARNLKNAFAGKPTQTICTFALLVSQERVDQTLDEYARYPGSEAVVLNGLGEPFAAGTVGSIDAPLISELSALIQSDASTAGAAFWNAYYNVWSRSPSSGYTYVLLTPRAHVAETSSGILRLAAGLGVFLSVMLALFLTLVTRGVILPVQRLALAMKAVTPHRFDVSVALPAGMGVSKEIGDVCRGFNEMVGSLRALFNLAIEKEKQKQDYQIATLKYQINPHFLHNTLNSIRFRALQHRDEATANMLMILSRLLRNTLANGSLLIPFCQEMENIQDYLALQQIRYDYGLRVRLDIAPEAASCLTPSMILQPIVENAIGHGLNEKLNMGGLAKIDIAAWTEDVMLRLCVTDNGEGVSHEKLAALLEAPVTPQSGEKIGLANIHHRIRLLCGDAYGLRIESQPGAYTKVFIDLPLQEG
jgi:two-component system sensor histidine kinase YesM